MKCNTMSYLRTFVYRLYIQSRLFNDWQRICHSNWNAIIFPISRRRQTVCWTRFCFKFALSLLGYCFVKRKKGQSGKKNWTETTTTNNGNIEFIIFGHHSTRPYLSNYAIRSKLLQHYGIQSFHRFQLFFHPTRVWYLKPITTALRDHSAL